MEGEHRQRKVRKGAKSCTDCRRRKVRCIRVPADALTCRRCEERSSECIEQTYGPQESQVQRIPTGYRVSQLESKLTSLSRAVRDIESRLGFQRGQSPEPTVDGSPGSSVSNEDSGDSDVVTGEHPSQLHSLFQNDWISMDTSGPEDRPTDNRTKATADLLRVARDALQKLIPTKTEISQIASSSFKWLGPLRTLLPQPYTLESEMELLQIYDDMHKPDVDALVLASWLLTVALTAQQTPQGRSLATTSEKYHTWLVFSHTLSSTVETKVLRHDKLVGTIQGLGVAMQFFRLQISQGNFQKAWLRLRHFIAIAELMGLPKSFRADQVMQSDGRESDETQRNKAHMWELICSADRMTGMIINIPPCTRQYQQVKPMPLTVDDVVQPQVYFSRLTNIAANIQYLDGASMMQGVDKEPYVTAMDLVRQLRVLASDTPKAWWTEVTEHAKPDHIVQFMHYCVLMRLHLPFAMSQDPGEEYFYNRMACAEACESVTRRYLFLRQKLPSGIFLARILDLQVFTATVILLLTSHGSSSDLYSVPHRNNRVESTITEIVELMAERSNDTVSSDIARNGASTIRSLARLFQQDSDAAHVDQLRLNVPLLGKVHIRRNMRTEPLQDIDSTGSFQTQTATSQWQQSEQVAPQYKPGASNTYNQIGLDLQIQEEQRWDPFTWAIEANDEDFFHDVAMSDLDQFPIM